MTEQSADRRSENESKDLRALVARCLPIDLVEPKEPVKGPVSWSWRKLIGFLAPNGMIRSAKRPPNGIAIAEGQARRRVLQRRERSHRAPAARQVVPPIQPSSKPGIESAGCSIEPYALANDAVAAVIDAAAGCLMLPMPVDWRFGSVVSPQKPRKCSDAGVALPSRKAPTRKVVSGQRWLLFDRLFSVRFAGKAHSVERMISRFGKRRFRRPRQADGHSQVRVRLELLTFWQTVQTQWNLLSGNFTAGRLHVRERRRSGRRV